MGGQLGRLRSRDTHLRADAEPGSEVLRVGEGGGEADEPDVPLGALRDVAHARHNHLEDGPSVRAEEVDLVDDDDAYHLDVAARLPVARDAVPLLRRADDDVGCEERPQVGGVVPCTRLIR